MQKAKINHLAVWLLILGFQVLSTLWFSPVVFAERWMAFLGKEFKDFGGESFSGIFFSVIGAIAYCYFLAWLFLKLKIEKGIQGLSFGFLLGAICFVLPTFTQDSFSLRPYGLSLINSFIILINFSMAGFILASWKKYKTI
jgi:hypothetical protein